ncbi:uncharacterized protein EAE97_003875 [Botrytis byssoidea]|uniref:Uncharacterized protein n=1 Tax=Botrytis byssoidea TaxID=139641 RepID=A0A9P5LWP1_9HELO|nr:uncharacterized protein EAE97_003875 [Botrytis byssoidea]KAF7948464.1 hypothetical protein EAE97_003875 [Botrytis byssoidea]
MAYCKIKITGNVYYQFDEEKQVYSLIFPPGLNGIRHNVWFCTSSGIDFQKLSRRKLNFTEKDLLGFVGPDIMLEYITTTMNCYRTKWDLETWKNGMHNVIQLLRADTEINFREDVKYEDEEHKIVKWEEHKYSAKVYEILKKLAPEWDNTRPLYVPKIRAASPGLSNENPKEGATVVEIPSTYHDCPPLEETSSSKKATGSQQKKDRKPKTPSKSRPFPPKTELAHRHRDGNPSSKSDNIKDVKSSVPSSSTRKPPAAQPKPILSSTREPPQTRGGSGNSANSASNPQKTENGRSHRTPHHGKHSHSGETARKAGARTSKTEKG